MKTTSKGKFPELAHSHATEPVRAAGAPYKLRATSSKVKESAERQRLRDSFFNRDSINGNHACSEIGSNVISEKSLATQRYPCPAVQRAPHAPACTVWSPFERQTGVRPLHRKNTVEVFQEHDFCQNSFSFIKFNVYV